MCARDFHSREASGRKEITIGEFEGQTARLPSSAPKDADLGTDLPTQSDLSQVGFLRRDISRRSHREFLTVFSVHNLVQIAATVVPVLHTSGFSMTS